MTIEPASEKDALTWLDRMLACSNPGTDAERSVLTLKAMVAEPRLPAEPTTALLDAMITVDTEFSVGKPREFRRRATYYALYAYLTKPATKEIEVWHVEWCDGSLPHIDDPYPCRDMADRGARLRREEGRGSCIRVTGPHKQTVPA